MARTRRLSRRSAALVAVAAGLVAMGGAHVVVSTTSVADAFSARAADPGEVPSTGPVTVTVPPTPTAGTTASTDAATATPAITVPTDCSPTTAPVDPEADDAARCLAQTLDDWAAKGVTGVGQQVNISSDSWEQPLRALRPARPAVVGFDLGELVDALGNGKDWTSDLVGLVQQGAVLTASWHAPNPWTGGGSFDTTGQGRLADLLDDDTAAAKHFWASWGEVTDRLLALQAQGAAAIVRPLHEVGGDWFWWGQPDPATYRSLFAELQQRTAAAGVHNVLWAYGAALKTWEGVDDPTSLLPDHVDLAGLDTYDCESSQPGCTSIPADEVGTDRVDLTGYADLAARVPRMALTEVGPSYSTDGSWDPAVITRTLADQGLYATYALLWFDDSAGRKQISSLQGGPAWLAGCPGGLCG